MTKNHLRIAFLISPLAASVLLISCVDPGYSSGGLYSSYGSSRGVYTTLPTSFSGNAYYHDGRYYSGGNYQTGRYNYGGRQYTNRYHYDGKYIYGGKYQRHDGSRRAGNRDSSGRSHDHGASRRSRDYDSDRRSRRSDGRSTYTRGTYRR